MGDRGALADLLAGGPAGARGGQVALALRTGDGSSLPARLAWTPAGCAGDRTIAAVVLDDRERTSAEQRLAASERRWRTLLEGSSDVTWTAGPDGRPTWATSALTRRLGWGVDDVVGGRDLDFVHPEDLDAFRAAIDRVLDGRSVQEVLECRLRRADGGWTWVRETLTDLRHDPDVGALIGNCVGITEERRQQEVGAAQEARFYRSLMPQVILDRRGLMTEVNDALCALLGQDAPDLVGAALGEFVDGADAGRTGAALGLLLRGEQEAVQTEALLTRRHGPALPVVVDATVLRGTAGEPDGLAAYLHDLSGLREQERQRQVQAEFFDALSSRASDLAVVSDTEGRVLYASPAVEQLFGYDVQDVVGCSGWDFVHPDEVVEQEGTRTVVAPLRQADGAWRWVEVTLTSFLDTAVAGIVGNLRDVTDRVESERLLRASELRYRAIADTAEEGIWALTPDGRTLYANGRLASQLGVPLEQLYERRVGDLVGHELYGELLVRGSERLRRGPERYEVTYSHPDGTERSMWVSATPLWLADGTPWPAEGPRRSCAWTSTGSSSSTTRAATPPATSCSSRSPSVCASRPVPRPPSPAPGGDEFVVVCEDMDADGVHAVGQRLLDALAAPVHIAGGPVRVAASIGTAISPPRCAADLLRYADVAMYAAKSAGRGRMRLFDAGPARDAERQYAVAGDLRGALAEDSLELHYPLARSGV